MTPETSKPAGAPASGENRRAWAFLSVVLLVYVIGYAAWWPSVLTVVDESSYVHQAVIFAKGAPTDTFFDPSSGTTARHRGSDYPVGTSALMAVMIYVFGSWRAIYLVPLLSFLVSAVLMGMLLQREGRSPLWTLLLIFYLPVLVLTRVGMSDVLCLMLVLLTLVMLMDPGTGRMPRWVAGFVGGASLVVRETAVLGIGPLMIGTFLRGKPGRWGMVLTGLAGISVRLVTAQLAFGDPLFYKTNSGFSAGSISQNIGIVLVAVLVLLPGGLVASSAYKGRRRAEIVATAWVGVLFFLVYSYSATSSSTIQRMVLAPRFFIPILPAMILGMAESVPRLTGPLWAFLRDKTRISLDSLKKWGLGSCLAGCVVVAFSIHPVMENAVADYAAIKERIYSLTPPNSTLIIDPKARKYTNPVYGPRNLVSMTKADMKAVARIVANSRSTYLVLVYRNNSELWQERSAYYTNYLDSVRSSFRTVTLTDQRITPSLRLEIAQVLSPKP